MLRKILESANMPGRRPELGTHFSSNLPGVHVIGDLAGAPVVKLAMEQGRELGEYLAGLGESGDVVVVVGAGAAGLNCALTLRERGRRVVVLEKARVANTFFDFPAGKWVYDEPVGRPAAGPLWLGAATREELLARWEAAANGLDIRVGEGVTGLERAGDGWVVRTAAGGAYRAGRVVIATGLSGTPRRLGVPGEDGERVHHRLYNPGQFAGERIVVVGGGNAAAEAALALAETNEVTLIHRGAELHRLFRGNRERIASGKVRVRTGAEVAAFGDGEVTLRGGERMACERAFVLIGSEAPSAFLQGLGLRLEGDWSGSAWLAAGLLAGVFGGLAVWPWLAVVALALLVVTGWRGNRWSWLALSMGVSYTIYGVKGGDGNEFWPFRGWGHALLSFGGRPWSFWYTVIFTGLMTVFGLQAAKRWGWDYRDRFQLWRYASLIGFQWLFFFLIPEFLVQMAVRNQWVGEALAQDPNFTNNLWRSYGLVYAWPLFFHTFLGNPHKVWVYWGLLLSFGIIPALVVFHGKRYCSWICGCGGLAETVGDRWRHLAPKGETAARWERMNSVVLGAAVVVTLLVLGRDVWGLFGTAAVDGMEAYHLIADVWLVGILPVGLYPFLGGKVWCRYWCPLAKMMELFSAWYTRMRWSRFAIRATEKCIACGECTRNCQVGIDVMRFAMLQREINNENSSCIGCGICITVCPMDVLHFGEEKGKQKASSLVQIQ